MAAEKVAFIIPVHPYMYPLLGDLEGSNVDLILVFSNQGDYDEFSLKDKIGKVMLPPGETRNIVTWKKFYALQQLRDSAYDYAPSWRGFIDPYRNYRHKYFDRKRMSMRSRD